MNGPGQSSRALRRLDRAFDLRDLGARQRPNRLLGDRSLPGWSEGEASGRGRTAVHATFGSWCDIAGGDPLGGSRESDTPSQ